MSLLCRTTYAISDLLAFLLGHSRWSGEHVRKLQIITTTEQETSRTKKSEGSARISSSVAQVVVSSLELDEVLQNILSSAMGIMDMPAGSIALYDEEPEYGSNCTPMPV